MHKIRFLGYLIGIVLLAACSPNPSSATVSILADENRFSPNRVEVLAGKPATLNFYNIGDQEHQFAIQEMPLIVQDSADSLAAHVMTGMSSPVMAGDPPQLHVVAPVGEQAQLTFVPAEAGEYTFQCILPGHTEEGVLVVQ